MDDISKEYRNNIHELKYFGSDYNKFLNKECTKQMTVNNIDCIQYKRSLKILRIVESKHSKEGGKETQMELLELIASIFRFFNMIIKATNIIFKVPFPINKLEIYKLHSDYPFSTAKIIDIITTKEYAINSKSDLIKWSNFEMILND